MSHIVGKSAYKSLEDRINRFPQGAPPSKTLHSKNSKQSVEAG